MPHLENLRKAKGELEGAKAAYLARVQKIDIALTAITEAEKIDIISDGVRHANGSSETRPKTLGRFAKLRIAAAVAIVCRENNGKVRFDKAMESLTDGGCDLKSRPERHLKMAIGQSGLMKLDGDYIIGTKKLLATK